MYEHVITTDAERNDVPSCRFLSWKLNFSLGLLTANLAGEKAGKKRGGEESQGYGTVPVRMYRNFTLAQTIKAGRRGGVDLQLYHFLSIGARWDRVVNATPGQLYSW